MLDGTPQEIYIVGRYTSQGPFYSLAQAKLMVDHDHLDGAYAFAIIPPNANKALIIEATRSDLYSLRMTRYG